jgi:flagellar hook-associated protein 3 FlgL
MRVTTSTMLQSTMRDLAQGLSRLQDTQTRLSSGKELIRPSYDPSGTSTAMGLRQDLRRADQHARSLDDAQGWLDTADQALTASLSVLTRAKDVAIRAASSGAIGDVNGRTAYASELRSMRAELLSLANTSFGQRSVFNGTAAGAAYDSSGVYQGNSASVVRDVALSVQIPVNMTGPQIFGTAGGAVGDVFEVIDRLATAVLNGDANAITTEQANLQTRYDGVANATVEIGTRAARVEETRTRAAELRGVLTERLSQVEDVDIVEALITAKAQEGSYQASLQAVAKILPMSLLDFLR